MENQRVRVTKRMLKEALVRLLQQKTIDKVKVQELCREAEINRTTFYKYYGSQYDLLEEVKKEFLQQIETNLKDVDEPRQLVNALCYVREYKDLFRVLIRTLSDDGFLQSIISLSYIDEGLDHHLSVKFDGLKKDYVKEFMLHGAYAIVVKWISDDGVEAPEQIAETIMEMVEKVVE